MQDNYSRWSSRRYKVGHIDPKDIPDQSYFNSEKVMKYKVAAEVVKTIKTPFLSIVYLYRLYRKSS